MIICIHKQENIVKLVLGQWPCYFQLMAAIKTNMSERMVIVVSLNQQFLSPALISSQG